MNKKYKIVPFLIALIILLLAPIGLAAPPQQNNVTCADEVIVQADDWLSKIAEKAYGDPLAYPTIFKATNAKYATDNSFAQIEDPNLIEIGWKLCIPEHPIAPDVNTPSTIGSSYLDNVSEYAKLYQDLQKVPLLTTENPNLSYNNAYTFQEKYVQALQNSGMEQIGYKLGLTGPQKPFGATEAVYGRLFASMQKEDGTVINTADFVQGMIEVEILFTFAKDVTYPISKEDLQASISHIAPAIELPDLMYTDLKNLTWLDLIATNVAPRQLIVGKGIPINEVNEVEVNTIETTATLNGEIINQAPATDAMGDQWEALLFLIERLNERGYQIYAGDVVLTGALGSMLPGKPGLYQVNYGTLGEINFEIQ